MFISIQLSTWSQYAQWLYMYMLQAIKVSSSKRVINVLLFDRDRTKVFALCTPTHEYIPFSQSLRLKG